MVQDERSSSVTSSDLQHFSLMPLSPGIGPPYQWLRAMKPEERGLCLIHLLLTCTKNVAAGSIQNSNLALEYISHLVSPTGDAMQRIATYLTEALADRTLKALPGLHKALNATKTPSLAEDLLVRKLFFEHCPFLKILYLVTNQAIIEAMEGEKMVHIIDLHACEPAQWINLLQAFSRQPGGPPHLRITGIHSSKEALDVMALQLNQEAENLDIPFQFIPMITQLESLDFESLRVKTGEALAISSVFQLHTLLSLDDSSHNTTRAPSPESASSSSQHTPSKLGGFISALRGLSPKLMVVSEQEADHNGSSMVERTMEAMHYYAALFDCLESNTSRESVERRMIEKMLFGAQIKDIVACEGSERKERHERLEKWVRRLGMAGFGRAMLSHESVVLGIRFLESSSSLDGYRIKEEGGCIFICWQERPLFSVSSWRSRLVL